MYFKNRRNAGQVLTNCIFEEWKYKNPVVISLPNRGISVAYQIAKCFRAPLGIIPIVNITSSDYSDHSIGAIGGSNQIWINNDELSFYDISQPKLDKLIAHSMRQVFYFSHAYEKFINKIELNGRSIILVDDGIVTGSKMLLALRSLKAMGVKEVLVLVPVSTKNGYELVKSEADFIFSAHIPQFFGSINEWYENYDENNISDNLKYLKIANHSVYNSSYKEVFIPIVNEYIYGEMYHPINSKGWVIFVHDIDSSRKNHFDLKIANKLKKSGFSILMFDLITENEGKENSDAKKIILFKERLKLITNWLIHSSEWNHLPIGYYGSGYGAAIALDVKISTDFNISTIVCRDGHLEIVSHLENINCPVKLLVGSRYEKMISFNHKAKNKIPNAQLGVVSSDVETMSNITKEWFENKL